MVIQKATAKRPADRYADVTTLIQELRQALASGPAVPRDDRRAADASQPDMATAPPAERRHARSMRPACCTCRCRWPSRSRRQLENPYKGLRAFQEADAADFFGREVLTQLLLERMQEQVPLRRFLAVVGPSGSGKSSVVRAGLVPALRRGGLPGSENWFVVEMFPGAHPLEELAQALLRMAVDPPNNLVEPAARSTSAGCCAWSIRCVPGDG